MCYTNDNCIYGTLYSAALSDCVLLSAPPVCTIDTILESYTMCMRTEEAGMYFLPSHGHWENEENRKKRFPLNIEYCSICSDWKNCSTIGHQMFYTMQLEMRTVRDFSSVLPSLNASSCQCHQSCTEGKRMKIYEKATSSVKPARTEKLTLHTGCKNSNLDCILRTAVVPTRC